MNSHHADAAAAALNRARDAVGGPVKLAALLSEHGLNIKSQAVSQWKRVPATRAHLVEKVTGIPCHELRPDVFPAPEGQPNNGAVPQESA